MCSSRFLVAPSLVKNGLAVGVPADEVFPERISYQALSFRDPDQYVDAPSPRYWLLWPGVLVMLLYSFADILLSLTPFFKSMFTLPPYCSVAHRVRSSQHYLPQTHGVDLTPGLGSAPASSTPKMKIRHLWKTEFRSRGGRPACSSALSCAAPSSPLNST